MADYQSKEVQTSKMPPEVDKIPDAVSGNDNLK